jgi:hypothetical protein
VFHVASDATSLFGHKVVLDKVFQQPDEVARREACLVHIFSPDARDDDASRLAFLEFFFSDRGGEYMYRIPLPHTIKVD